MPAIAPYALDIIGTALRLEGHEVEILDLTPSASDYKNVIGAYFSKNAPDFVGITFRNIWDLYFGSFLTLQEQGSFVPSHSRVTREVLRYIERDRIIAGGVGFSSYPEYVLEQTGLRFGVLGTPERDIGHIISSLKNGVVPHHVESFFEYGHPYSRQKKQNMIDAVIDRKNFVDNKWYYLNSGSVPLRTSNGCPMACSYCLEPTVKGKSVSRRTGEQVLGEVDQLLGLEIMDIYSADSESNIPFGHSKKIKQRIIERKYPRDLHFWEYCTITPFDEEYAELAAEAGVKGIYFTADHIKPELIKALGRWHSADDVRRTANICKEFGIRTMFEVLLGMPGETEDTIKEVIDFFKDVDPDVTGMILGIAAIPSSPLYKSPLIMEGLNLNPEERKKHGIYCSGELFKDPTYYIDPAIKVPEIYDVVKEYIGKDVHRFMVPTREGRAFTDDTLINNNRVTRQIRERKMGADWYYYREMMTTD